jgi:DNA-binding CsgD family transcriptional regulator
LQQLKNAAHDGQRGVTVVRAPISLLITQEADRRFLLGVHMAGNAAAGRLTPRQTEIAQVLAGGASRQEIACRLHISPRTVKRHLQHVALKLGTQGDAQLVAAVLLTDLVDTARVWAELAPRLQRVGGINQRLEDGHGC